jgi:hypothetical protein
MFVCNLSPPPLSPHPLSPHPLPHHSQYRADKRKSTRLFQVPPPPLSLSLS